MMLIVYVKDTHAKYITRVTSETVGTGIMGMLGNKGGVSIRYVLEFGLKRTEEFQLSL